MLQKMFLQLNSNQLHRIASEISDVFTSDVYINTSGSAQFESVTCICSIIIQYRHHRQTVFHI